MQKLKKAKRAVWLARWLSFRLPTEYHCMAVNLECCSMPFLKSYLSCERLDTQAELLLIEKYLNSNPELILSYIDKHGGNQEMHFEILKKAPRDLIVKILKQQPAYPRLSLSTSSEAQVILVNREDNRLFEYVLLRLSHICEAAITEIIKQQKTDMLRLLFKRERKSHFRSLVIPVTLQLLLIEQNNAEMFDCYNQYCEFDQSVMEKLIEKENCVFWEALLKRQHLSVIAQKYLAQYGSPKMIACFLQKHPMVLEAQIELIKRDYKDLLKLHYLKYGIANEAMLYLLSLNNFKAYIGI